MIYDIVTDSRFWNVAAEVTWFQISSVQFDIYAYIPKESASIVFLFSIWASLNLIGISKTLFILSAWSCSLCCHFDIIVPWSNGITFRHTGISWIFAKQFTQHITLWSIQMHLNWDQLSKTWIHRALIGIWKCVLYEQFPFIYRFILHVLFIKWWK